MTGRGGVSLLQRFVKAVIDRGAVREVVKMVPTGQATIPYPQLDIRAQAMGFALCEKGLLSEIAHAQDTARALNNLTPPVLRFVVPWIVLPTRATNGIAIDTEGRGPHRGDMQVVVEWLVAAGALRPLSELQRDELMRAEETHRMAQGSWKVLFESKLPEYLEVFDREVTRDAWEVIPAVMLEVYPELVSTGTAWSTLRGPGAHT
jgi:hypothetical protein